MPRNIPRLLHPQTLSLGFMMPTPIYSIEMITLAALNVHVKMVLAVEPVVTADMEMAIVVKAANPTVMLQQSAVKMRIQPESFAH